MNLNFAENLKQLRKGKEITQEKLADVLNVTGQTISRWELGICYPDLELLPAIANFFGVSIDILLSNDASSKEKDLEKFKKLIDTFSVIDGEQIEFVKSYCQRYPENDYYAFMLVAVIKDYFVTKGPNMDQYMPLLHKTAQRLLETQYRNFVIQTMAMVCDEKDLSKWLNLSPYSGFSRRYCWVARAHAHQDWEMAYMQTGIEMFETLAGQLDSRCVDAKGPYVKELFHRDVLKIIRSFGTDGKTPDGWKLFYAYKQLVLASCLFAQKKVDEGWEQFDAALEKCKYIHSLNDELLDIGGPLFSNLKVSKDWRYVRDEKQRKCDLFGLSHRSFYNLKGIHYLLTNPAYVWFNSVRETEKYQSAVKWVEETKRKLEEGEE